MVNLLGDIAILGLRSDALTKIKNHAKQLLHPMCFAKGVWQKGYPELSYEFLYLLSTDDFGEMILSWPESDSLTGRSTVRSLVKARNLQVEIRRFLFAGELVKAQLDWTLSTEHWDLNRRSDVHRDQMRWCSLVQAAIMEASSDQLKEHKVPSFDVTKAAGSPGYLNYVQPRVIKSKTSWKPPDLTGKPSIEDVKEFLRIRLGADGEPLLNLLKEPVYHADCDRWEFRFAGYDENLLPERSEGPFAWENRGRPDFQTRWHGTKIECLYSVMADISAPSGGLLGSIDYSDGVK